MATSNTFDFDAPQAVDFTTTDDDPYADRFFDVIEDRTKNVNEHLKTPTKKPSLNAHFSDLENTDPNTSIDEPPTVIKAKQRSPVLRKVLNEISSSNIIHQNIATNKTNVKDETTVSPEGKVDLIEILENMHIDVNKSNRKHKTMTGVQVYDGLVLPSSTQKTHRMTTRLDTILKTPVLKLRNRSVTRPKRSSLSDTEEETCSVTSTISEDNQRVKPDETVNHITKFVALAEQVQHFQKDTPERFRSKPRKTFDRKTIHQHVHSVPKSPFLSTMHRSRPSKFPSLEEREEQEWKEMQKFTIKANPVNHKILQGPCLNLKTIIEKKPNTIPEPFKLTEVKKKVDSSPKPAVFHFKACPLPTKILKSPQGIPPKKVQAATTPYTPNIKVPARLRVEAVYNRSLITTPCASEKSSVMKKTKIVPFSFELRDKEMQLKKEEKIKKIIEEEKKKAIFKANPLPSRFLCEIRNHSLKVPEDSIQKHRTENVTPFVPFKARPSTVLHQKPFEPKKVEHEHLKPLDIHLSTEKRAKERKEFEDKLKQAEMEREMLHKKAKEEEEREIQKQIASQRKTAEFHARAVPQYKHFEIHPADPSKLTQPQSPYFRSGKSNQKKC